MGANAYDDLRTRNLICLEIATSENYYGTPLDEPGTHKPERLKNDGKVDPKRKYAPDSMPGLQTIIAMARLPKGFGAYANGLVILYSTTMTGGTTTNRSGYLNDGDFPSTSITAYWANTPYGALRCAVHRFAVKDEDYAQGWDFVPGINELTTPSDVDDVDSYSNLDDWSRGINSGVSAQVELPTGRIFTNRLGSFVMIETSDHIYQLNPDLTVGILDVAAGGLGASVHIDDSDDPVIWTHDTSTGTVVMCPLSKADGLRLEPFFDISMAATFGGVAGATIQYIGPPKEDVSFDLTLGVDVTTYYEEFGRIGQFVAPVGALVHPWASGDYGPPEMWFLIAGETVGQFAIYRSRWAAGQYHQLTDPFGTPVTIPPNGPATETMPEFVSYTLGDDATYSGVGYPAANPDGYGFEHFWYKTDNLVSTFTVPDFAFDTGSPGFQVFRDPAHANHLFMIIKTFEKPHDGVQNWWAGVSTDDGANWSLSRSLGIQNRNEPLGALTMKGFVSTWGGAIAITAKGVPVVGGEDYWNYYQGTDRVPFYSAAKPDVGAHLALLFPFGPAGPAATGDETGSEVQYKPNRRPLL